VSFLQEREGILLKERNIKEPWIRGAGGFRDFEIKFISPFDVREGVWSEDSTQIRMKIYTPFDKFRVMQSD